MKHEKHEMKEKMSKREKGDSVPDVVESAKKQPLGAGPKEGRQSKDVESIFGEDHLDHDAFSDKMTRSIRT